MSLSFGGVYFKVKIKDKELGYGYSAIPGHLGMAEAVNNAVSQFTQSQEFKEATYQLSGQLDIQLEYLVNLEMPT